jgi:hypothetical protein
MPELYANLPGFTVDYKDGGLVVPQVYSTADKIVLIGTATDGPKYEAIEIAAPNEDTELLFGKAYNTSYQSNGTTLMLGATEAYGAGARNIALMRIGGAFATADLTAMKLDSVYAGSLYNNIKYKIDKTADSEKLTIQKPTVKGGETLVFNLTDTKTITELVTEINDHLSNNVVVASVVTGHETDVAKTALTATPPYGTYATTFTAPNSNLVFTSKDTPDPGVSITMVAGSTDTAETTVAVVGNAITVTLGTTGDTIDATANEVKNAIEASTAAKALISIALASGSTGLGVVEALSSKTLTSTPSFVALAGGTDGPATTVLSDYINAMYRELWTAYDILEDYDARIVIPLGVFADYQKTVGGITTNFGEQLANFCSASTERNNETWGVISMTPTTTITQAAIKARVNVLTNAEQTTNLYYKLDVTVDENAETDAAFVTAASRIKDTETDRDKSVGHLISVIALPEGGFSHPVLGNYYAPITAAYGGFASSLPVESATTNKVIPNIKRLRYKLSPSQLDALTAQRFVTFKENNRAVSVVDGCTACEVIYDAAHRLSFRSDYWRLSTLRTVFKAVAEVRRVAEPFIGEPNGPEQQNALETAIKSALNAMKPKALTSYRFNIGATLQQRINGDSFINLELVPALERRKIRVTVALRPI